MNTITQTPPYEAGPTLGKDASGKEMEALRYRKPTDEKSKEFREFKRNVEEAPLIELGEGWREKSKIEKNLEELRQKELRGEQLTTEEKKRKAELEDKKADCPLDDEEMKLFLRDLFDRLPGLRKFAEEHCRIDFNTEKSEDGLVVTKPEGSKLVIELNPNSFFDYGTTKIKKGGKEIVLRYFNPAKAAYFIGQALGSILTEPKDWEKYADKIKITQNGLGSWEDFVALCLTNPDEAEKVSKEAFKLVRDSFYEPQGLRVLKMTKKKVPNKLRWLVDFRSEKDKAWDTPPDEGPFRSKLKRLWTNIKETYWRTSDWRQRAVAEFEAKEAARMKVRNESITDRDRRLFQIMGEGTENISADDRFFLRTLLLADMDFSDYGLWRLRAYLQATDKKFRSTNGEMIGYESYEFLMRLSRASQQKKRYGTKIMEYELIEAGKPYEIIDPHTGKRVRRIADERVFVRKDSEVFQQQVLEEISTFSPRMILNIEKEVAEYMKLKGKKEDGGYINPLNDRFNEGSPYLDHLPTGFQSEFLGKKFTENWRKNVCGRGEPVSKMDPDQIGYIARIIAEEAKARLNPIGSQKPTTIFEPPTRSYLYGAEHSPAHVVAAFENYKGIFVEDGRLRGYINYFLAPRFEMDADGRLTPKSDTAPAEEDELNRLLKEKATGDKDEQEEAATQEDAHKDVKEYDNVPEEDTKKTLIAKGPEKASQQVAYLERAARAYQKDVAAVIGRSSLDKSVKQLILEIIEKDEQVVEPYILEEIFDQYRAAFKEEPDLATKRKIQALENQLRPLRIERRNLTDLYDNMGIRPYWDKAAAIPKDKLKAEFIKEKRDNAGVLALKVKKGEASILEIKDQLGDLIPAEELEQIRNPDGTFNTKKAQEVLSLAEIALLAQNVKIKKAPAPAAQAATTGTEAEGEAGVEEESD